MSKIKKYIGLFLLAIFISVKLVGLHEFTHSEDEHTEECELCKFTITSDKTFFITNESFSFTDIITHYFKKDFSYAYSYAFIQNNVDSTLFSRPPPTI